MEELGYASVAGASVTGNLIVTHQQNDDAGGRLEQRCWSGPASTVGRLGGAGSFENLAGGVCHELFWTAATNLADCSGVRGSWTFLDFH